mmetsp:Transcript_12082/g.18661  ORF Transcript_12082/g.18661 Transcript_12082/m.18661 type:complete len:171 (-) Transcript_12082:1239-1751(-)
MNNLLRSSTKSSAADLDSAEQFLSAAGIILSEEETALFGDCNSTCFSEKLLLQQLLAMVFKRDQEVALHLVAEVRKTQEMMGSELSLSKSEVFQFVLNSTKDNSDKLSELKAIVLQLEDEQYSSSESASQINACLADIYETGLIDLAMLLFNFFEQEFSNLKIAPPMTAS